MVADLGEPAERGARLRHLLDDERLGLTLVRGSPETAFTAVRWAERGADRAWLGAGDIRLLPVELLRSDVATPSLERALRPAPAVLAVALSPSQRELPAGWEGRLPPRTSSRPEAVITVPPAVAPDLLEARALAALVAFGAGGGAPLVSPMEYLFGGLEDVKPERKLLERAYQLLGTDLVLVNPWGEVAARAGPGAWRPTTEGGGLHPLFSWAEGEVRLGGRDALLFRVGGEPHMGAGGSSGGRLVAFDPPGLARPWLLLLRALLTSAAAVHAADARTVAASRAALLAAWLAAPDSPVIARRLTEVGFTPGGTYLVGLATLTRRDGGAATASVGPQGTPGGSSLGSALAAYFADRGLTLLAEESSEGLLFAVAAPGQRPGVVHLGATLLRVADAALAAAPHRDPTSAPPLAARLGLSLPQSRFSEVAAAERQARLALGAVPPSGGWADFGAVDPITWLSEHHGEELAALRELTLGPLVEEDPQGKLMATLRTYLDSPTDLSATANALGVHPNTVRHRLKRIEELVGAPLSSPATLARLWLVTRQERL